MNWRCFFIKLMNYNILACFLLCFWREFISFGADLGAEVMPLVKSLCIYLQINFIVIAYIMNKNKLFGGVGFDNKS